MSNVVHIGSGFYYRTFTEEGVEGSTGLIIYGPQAPNCEHKKVLEDAEGPGVCGGGLHFQNSLSGQREGRPLWTVVQQDPLTITPSIKCACDGQHGYITEGKYVNAGGVVG